MVFICEDDETPLQRVELVIDKTKPLLDAYNLVAENLDLREDMYLRGYMFGYLNSYNTPETYNINEENNIVYIHAYSKTDFSRHIHIHVRDYQGDKKKMTFKLNRYSRMSKIIAHLAQAKKVSPDDIKLNFKGQAILPDYLPLHIGLEENDVLDINRIDKRQTVLTQYFPYVLY